MVSIAHGSVIYHHPSAPDGWGAPPLVALALPHPLLLPPWGIWFSHPSMGCSGLHRRKWALLSIFEASKEVLSMRIGRGFNPTARLADEYSNWAGSFLLKSPPQKTPKPKPKKSTPSLAEIIYIFQVQNLLKEFKTSFELWDLRLALGIVGDGKAWVNRNGSRKSCSLRTLYFINKSPWSQAPSPVLIPIFTPVVSGVDLDLGSQEKIWSSSKIMDKELKISSRTDWCDTATSWRSLLSHCVLLSAVLKHPRYLINSVFQSSLPLCHKLTSLVA